ncbi:hypothetical protein BC834DRAFT_832137 [Gloeopeniophorella convolvens]|nr:hypothetical protein BC834DRAFT_832137 [Gloeopeniophorella convolvens]
MVQAVHNGTVVAESSNTVFVEGNHYFALEDIKVDLAISETTYTCPYKGHASYYNADVNGTQVKDIAWYVTFLRFCLGKELSDVVARVYPQPTSKFEIKGRYAFDKVNVLQHVPLHRVSLLF